MYTSQPNGQFSDNNGRLFSTPDGKPPTNGTTVTVFHGGGQTSQATVIGGQAQINKRT